MLCIAARPRSDAGSGTLVRLATAGALVLAPAVLPLASAAPPPPEEKTAPPQEAAVTFGERLPTFGEQISVELIGIEVWVTDGDGEPVHGLTADDFQIRHDGEPVEITHFSEIRSQAPVSADAGDAAGADGSASSAAPAPEADRPGHLVVYFDQLRLDPGGYRSVVEGVRDVLAGNAVPAERVLVLRQDTGLHLEAPFGSSKAEVEAALDRVAQGSHVGLAAAAELEQAQSAILAAWEESQSLAGSGQSGLDAVGLGGGGGAGGGGDTGFGGGGPRGAVGGSGSGGGSILPSACEIFHQRAQPVVNSWIRERGSRVSITLSHLSGAAGFLSGLDGVKTLLYVSDGLDIEPGAALAGYVSDFCPTRTRDGELEALAESLSADFRALAARLNARRITVHAVQGSGLRDTSVGLASERGTSAPVGGRLRFETRQRQSDRSGMSLLTSETGGRAVFNQNDVTDELVAIGRDMGNYYSLAYRPPAAESERGERAASRIEVKLDDDSLRARYRRGFRPLDPQRWMTDRLAGALHLGITDNPLDLRLGMGEPPADDGEPLRLFALLPLDRLVFVPGAEGEEAQLELLGSVQSSGADEPLSIERQFRLRKPPGAEGERVQLPLELPLGAGAHRVAIGVRDVHSGEASFVTTNFELGS